MKKKTNVNKKKPVITAVLAAASEPPYVLRLYVAGFTPRSVRAIKSIRKICDDFLSGRCDLEIIDIAHEPGVARKEQIIAVPTLIKKEPLPVRRFIGTLSDRKKLLAGLNLQEKEDNEADAGTKTEPW